MFFLVKFGELNLHLFRDSLFGAWSGASADEEKVGEKVNSSFRLNLSVSSRKFRLGGILVWFRISWLKYGLEVV